jgi:hypothetical protein
MYMKISEVTERYEKKNVQQVQQVPLKTVYGRIRHLRYFIKIVSSGTGGYELFSSPSNMSNLEFF